MRCCCFILICLVLLEHRGALGFYRLETYYYAAPTQPRTTTYYRRSSLVTASPTKSLSPYQMYLACSPRTFIFKECTLCFCTDEPKVALCWDHETDECRLTRAALATGRLQE